MASEKQKLDELGVTMSEPCSRCGKEGMGLVGGYVHLPVFSDVECTQPTETGVTCVVRICQYCGLVALYEIAELLQEQAESGDVGHV